MELITAIATAPGAGGIAIVRVSGDGALSLAQKMFSRKGNFIPYHMYPGTIDCGKIRDMGMCVYFAAPHSYTGEDTVEFHCHGGTEIVRSLLRRTIELGARQAEPGEFTRRAYLNGKLSLSAVEGLGEMIAARSSAQVRAGYLLLGEKLSEKARKLQELVLSCLAEADADVDYPEEDLSIDLFPSVLQKTAPVKEEIENLLAQYPAGRKIGAGVRVVLCGRPNAGKSSLLNALCGYERAIVSDCAGTTRDLVESETEIGGVRFLLIDTAGLREGENEVEREGVRRAENAIKSADMILYLKEEGDNISLPKDIPVIVVGAKCDVKVQDGCEIYVSSVTGEGIGKLKELLFERGFGSGNDEVFILEERHRDALKEALDAVTRARECAKRGAETDLLAQELKTVYFALGKITGETANEEILREIFGRFCVGK